MKKILLFVLVVASATAHAQEFKKFKFGIGMAPAIYMGAGYGAQIYFEPTFRITDDLAVSYKLDVTGRFRGSGFPGGNAVEPFISNTFNAQYYFAKGTFRPFVGMGLGLFTHFEYAGFPAGSKFGFCPRVGFDLSHFNLSIDYNFVPATQSTSFFSGFGQSTATVSNSYLAVRFGISIGGGKIK